MSIIKKKRDQVFLSLPNMALMLVVSLLVVGSDIFFNLPFDLQGESGLLSTAVIVIAVGLVPHLGTATIVGMLAGLFAAIVDISQHGWLYTFVTVAALGIGIEIGVLIMGSVRQSLVAIVVAALGNLVHFATKWFYGVLINAPVGVIPTRVPQTVLQHILFGLLGGLLGFGFIRLLDKWRSRTT